MPTPIHRRVAACRAGTDPTCIARLAAGWAVLGDPQVLPGYCLLLPDPVVPHLNAFSGAERLRFLADMALLGDAVLQVTAALRINYALFGNQAPALHAHVFPRFSDEPAFAQTGHPWVYDWAERPAFDAAAHALLQQQLRAQLALIAPAV
jgi:diadenosine tetraphosphate (Ap4A) HIT family hydrolase